MTKEELEKMTVADVLVTDLFREKMAEVMSAELDNQQRAAAAAHAKGARIGRTPLDGLREKGAWEVEKMADLYAACLTKTLIGYSSNERAYIILVGMNAYRRTIKKMQACIGE